LLQISLSFNHRDLQQEQTGRSKEVPLLEERWVYSLEEQEPTMNIIEGIVDGFIITVGITPPTPAKKRAATIFIAVGLFATVAGVLGVFGFVLHQLVAR
jgi:hypothetical protein